MPSKSVKLTPDLHEQLVERKRRPFEAIEDVIRRDMGLDERTEALSD
jgi:predicted nucleic acid-binding OB-fold protein